MVARTTHTFRVLLQDEPSVYRELQVASSTSLNRFAAAITIPLLIIMRYGVSGREECYLNIKFGELYRQYKIRVRRWL